MPIDVKAMEKSGKEVSVVRNAHTQDTVLAFLKKNKANAYTQAEIGSELGIKPQQARQCCHALMKKGKAGRKTVTITTDGGKPQDQIFWRYTQ